MSSAPEIWPPQARTQSNFCILRPEPSNEASASTRIAGPAGNLGPKSLTFLRQVANLCPGFERWGRQTRRRSRNPVTFSRVSPLGSMPYWAIGPAFASERRGESNERDVTIVISALGSAAGRRGMTAAPSWVITEKSAFRRIGGRPTRGLAVLSDGVHRDQAGAAL